MYAADSNEGAYLESLAWAYVNEKDGSRPLNSLFDETEDRAPYADDEELLMDQVNKEWAALGVLPWGQLPPDWRINRTLYHLQLPESGYFIDVGRSATLSAIASELPRRMAEHGVRTLTQSELYGGNRGLTTMISAWLRGRVLFDGSRPVGIRYRSKFGDEFPCYAVWLRALAAGKGIEEEAIKVIGSSSILASDPDLLKAAGFLNLTVH